MDRNVSICAIQRGIGGGGGPLPVLHSTVSAIGSRCDKGIELDCDRKEEEENTLSVTKMTERDELCNIERNFVSYPSALRAERGGS